jgi:hypothetical protein
MKIARVKMNKGTVVTGQLIDHEMKPLNTYQGPNFWSTPCLKPQVTSH